MTRDSMGLTSLLLGFFDESGHTLEVVGRELFGGDVEESGDDLGGRVLEEGRQEMADGGEFRLGGSEIGQEDVLEAFVAMGDVAFLFEGAEEGADGGVGGRIGEGGENFSGGGGAALIEDIHDLTFAAGKGGGLVLVF